MKETNIALQNHSCDPNVRCHPVYTDDADIDKPLVAAFTCEDVDSGEELCISYDGDGDSDGDGDNRPSAVSITSTSCQASYL